MSDDTSLYTIPFQIDPLHYSVVVALTETNIVRILQYDPAEIATTDFGPPFSGLALRDVIVTFATAGGWRACVHKSPGRGRDVPLLGAADMNTSSEIERLKTALALTREHNIRLTEENRRLRARLRLPTGEVTVKVHPDFMPPPPVAPESKARRRYRDLYDGDKPLRTQWPLTER